MIFKDNLKLHHLIRLIRNLLIKLKECRNKKELNDLWEIFYLLGILVG
jgi:hypothetical protein